MSQSAISKPRLLGVFSLAMITAGSVDSIRNLPATALFGASLIFFFIFGALFFLLPSALVSAELASTCDEHGGVYVWVKKAFGLRLGFLAIWFQWIENVIWYPTILSFIAATMGYLIMPDLATNKFFLMAIILTTFWGVTFINLLGIQASARFSNFCAVSGLLIPMALIIALGAVWCLSGKPLQLNFTASEMLPHWGHSGMWVALTGIMLSFCGMEIATVHGFDVDNPQRAYPRAMLISTLIIVVTLLCGSLAIAIVLPADSISLVAGIMQAFHAFFKAYHMQWVLPVIAVMLVIGGMGGVNNWVIAPTRGLLLALQDNAFGRIFCWENRRGAPGALLLWQAVIATLVTLSFLLMPSVNASYWLLTALSAQLYMIMYIILFSAAIRLRYKPVTRRVGFMIPGGRFGMWLVAGAGLLGSIVTLLVGFFPPDNIQLGGVFRYEVMLCTGLFVLSLPPFLMAWRKRA